MNDTISPKPIEDIIFVIESTVTAGSVGCRASSHSRTSGDCSLKRRKISLIRVEGRGSTRSDRRRGGVQRRQSKESKGVEGVDYWKRGTDPGRRETNKTPGDKVRPRGSARPARTRSRGDRRETERGRAGTGRRETGRAFESPAQLFGSPSPPPGANPPGVPSIDGVSAASYASVNHFGLSWPSIRNGTNSTPDSTRTSESLAPRKS